MTRSPARRRTAIEAVTNAAVMRVVAKQNMPALAPMQMQQPVSTSPRLYAASSEPVVRSNQTEKWGELHGS